jgi:hypothetical protein
MLKIVERTPAPDRTPGLNEAMPSFSWGELQEAMEAIAASPRQREMVEALVSATRKQAPFLPQFQVLREILSLAWVVADESFGETPAP